MTMIRKLSVTMRRPNRILCASFLLLAMAQNVWAQAGAEGNAVAPIAPPAAAAGGGGLDTVLRGGITVNNEDIQDVLTILAQFSGLSMFASKAVVGRVSFSFPQDVSVRQVLDSVLPGYAWTYTYDAVAGTVQIRTIGETPPEIVDLVSKTFTLRNISPDRVMPIIQSMLSPNGKATVIPGTRDIRVEDIPDVIARIEALIPTLDRDRVTHVFQLEYITVEEAQAALEGIISAESGDIQVKPELGILIVTDIEENIRRAIAIIDVLDQDPLETIVVPINFADPSAVLDAIQPVLTPDAFVYYDERSSRIIIRDIPSKVAIAADIIKAMDIAPLQVFVEGELLSIGDIDAFEMGVEWETGEQVDIDSSTSTARLMPNALATLFTGGRFNLNYLDPQDFSIAINAVREHSKTRTLLSPRVLVVNDEVANIHEGTREPYAVRTRSNTIEGDDFISQRTQEVGIKLTIEPHISENGYVDMLVEIEDSDTLPPRNEETADLLRTRETRAETVVTVKSGRTIVIGGLIRKQSSLSRTGVPVLSQVPLIGMLFRNKRESETYSKLVLFITPHIVSVDDPYKISWSDEVTWDKRLRRSPYGDLRDGIPSDGEKPAKGEGFIQVPDLPQDVVDFIRQYMTNREPEIEPGMEDLSGPETAPVPEGAALPDTSIPGVGAPEVAPEPIMIAPELVPAATQP